MRHLGAAIATLSLIGSAAAQTQESKMKEEVDMVAPALEKYRQACGLVTYLTWTSDVNFTPFVSGLKINATTATVAPRIVP